MLVKQREEKKIIWKPPDENKENTKNKHKKVCN
jgi:hypothetical protein